MARAIRVSQGLISKVVNGQQNPGQRLLNALAAHPRINAEWVLCGLGQPVPFPEEGSLPVTTALLPGPPLRFPQFLSGRRHPVARDYARPTRYWWMLTSTSALVSEPALRLALGDLLLMEADEEWTRRPDMTAGRICGFRFGSAADPSYRAGTVTLSSRGATVRPSGGSKGPPLLVSGKRRDPRPGKGTREGRVRGLSEDDEKALKRDQAELTVLRVGAEVIAIEQKNIIAIAVYLGRPDPQIVPSGG